MHAVQHALLLSDVHLSLEAPDITRRFLHFLSTQTSQARALYILGDLFEVWIGDDAPGELGMQIAAALRQLARQGKSIHFMHGNRDFLLSEHYARQAGMQLLDDPCVVYFNEQPVLLSHGDAWCTDDVEYQQFRAQRSQPQTQAQFLQRPVAERLAFAKNARDASREHTRNSAADIMDVNPDAIEQAFSEHDISTIIHGHTHRPADHQYADERQRIVLGDWYQHASWLSIDADGIHRHGVTI